MDWLDEVPRAPKDLKNFYYDFFKDFREYLAEYVRESVVELKLAEIPISRPVKLFDGFTPGKVKVKNQGMVPCFLSATGMGGYRLDPGEIVEFFVNTQVMVTTVSGSTTLGFIKT
jgi:hypothetical protein